MTITVYSKPRCPQCDVAYRILNKQSIDYRSIGVTEGIDVLGYIRDLSHQQTPVIVAGDSHRSDFRPDRIKAAAAAHLDSASLAAGQA